MMRRGAHRRRYAPLLCADIIVCGYLNASLTCSPACFRSALFWSAFPSALRLLSSVVSPVPLWLYRPACRLCRILSPKPKWTSSIGYPPLPRRPNASVLNTQYALRNPWISSGSNPAAARTWLVPAVRRRCLAGGPAGGGRAVGRPAVENFSLQRVTPFRPVVGFCYGLQPSRPRKSGRRERMTGFVFRAQPEPGNKGIANVDRAIVFSRTH